MPDWRSITVSVLTHLIFRYHLPLTINVPVVNMAGEVMNLMRANPLKRPFKEGGLWNTRLFWALKWQRAKWVPFGPKKSRFSGSPLLTARARIFKLLRRKAGRYDNTLPTRFLAPIECLKIPAQDGQKCQPTRSTLAPLLFPGVNLTDIIKYH